ncbi:trafficking protein particle complex subunit 6B [Pyrenophora tritici-repentis Pt-1C-BFP]|uniref:Trafficking protein particle complex subunit 6B n=1 Tax=Pyrenophora tritici-repentis (strain Pt-1C-BFP) TaxID=426418 RepID=B2VVR7_PYRTR|nr:trafficking protein particle complex subunit 6B [Pyrenophora tritici-repentis Pt-1C-BFP]EDU40717.1 trafficking protein particle complex subunit 6B [Pyrenophora tritici-repentis Pt-1C-BFP]
MTSQPPLPPTDPQQPTYTDPTYSLINTSCLDLLLIELVPMAYRITADLAQREEEWIRGSSVGEKGRLTGTARGTDGGPVGGLGAGTATVDDEEAREAVFHRLESLGYRVGLGVVERVSRQTPRPTTPLDCIKFLCKDLWTLLFRKQIDNLKTNHRGIYVLTDNTFKPLGRMSFDTKKYDAAMQAALVAQTGDVALGRDANSQARVQPFLYFPAGLIRGCLASLGIQATVTAESAALPGATFQIRTAGAKN